MDAFITIDGIPGSSTSRHHPGEVEVLSWSWGITATTNPTAGGAGVGRPRAHEFRMIHAYDLASPPLAATAATGRHIREATLSVSRAGAVRDFLTVTMRDIVVTEVDVSGDDDAVTEAVALQPTWVRFAYTAQSPTGGVGTTSSFTWDIRTNTIE